MQTVLVKVVLLSCIVICLSQNNIIYRSNTKVKIVAENAKVKKIVHLSPNPSFDGNILIESFVEDALSLYLFDKDANLIRQLKLKGNSNSTVRNLKKGSYLYDVYLNEESIVNGNIIVK